MGKPTLIFAFVALVLAVAPAVRAARGAGDTRDEPAIESRRAVESLIVAAARAGTRLVVAGERGHVLYSDDAGVSWRQAKVPVSVTLTAVCFADDRTGWAVGHRGVVLKSDDGGQTWQRQLDGVRLTEALRAAVGNDDPQLVEEVRRFANDGADKPLLDVACTDPEHAAAVGAYGIAVKTADGGRTWSAVPALMAVSGLRHIYSLVAYGDGFVLVGEQGGVYRASSDWSRVEKLGQPSPGSFFDVVAPPGGALIAAGLRGSLFRSGDGGTTWTRVAIDSPLTFSAGIVLSDRSIVLLDEAGGAWRSTDDGRHFVRIEVPGAFPFAAMVEARDGRVLAVGARGVKWLGPIRSTPK